MNFLDLHIFIYNQNYELQANYYVFKQRMFLKYKRFPEQDSVRKFSLITNWWNSCQIDENHFIFCV